MNTAIQTNSSSAANREPCSVLLAEDSEDDAYFFQRALKKSGVHCALHRAANGKLAIEHLQAAAAGGDPRRLPDLIFLDLKMPVKSGFDVLDWMQEMDLIGKVKVVVLSGSNDHADQSRARESGAADYLVKPITPQDIRTQLQSLAPPATGVSS